MSFEVTSSTARRGVAIRQWQSDRCSSVESLHSHQAIELLRARNYPISRWYLRPLAGRLAAQLAPTPVRPVHLTCCGLAAAMGAAAVLSWRPEATALAAALVLVYWFFDRADGLLARRQCTVSAWGAWLDANIDELADVALHVAVAAFVAAETAAAWPWLLLVAFLAGKYLFMYGLMAEEGCDSVPSRTKAAGRLVPSLRWAYHLPGNADVRVHLLALALVSGYLGAELALVAGYYNVRWIARYVLVARRLGSRR